MDDTGFSPSDAAEEKAWDDYNLDRPVREEAYLLWCQNWNLDPQDTETMIRYEQEHVLNVSEEEHEAWIREWPGYAPC